MHGLRLRGQRAVVPQRFPVARGRTLGEPGTERGAGGDLGHRIRPRQAQAQVVRDGAGADDPHAFVHQRAERGAQLEQLRRRAVGREGDGQHGDVALRTDVAQRHPDAVVEPAGVGVLHLDAGPLQQLFHVGREARHAGHLVAQLVERAREAAEVVDGLVARGRQRHRAARQRMRGQRDDGRRRRLAGGDAGVYRAAQVAPERAGRAGLQRRHRRAVREEDGGVAGVHASIEAPAPRGAVRSDWRRHSMALTDRAG